MHSNSTGEAMNLTEEQKLAAENNSLTSLISASAGSGKTYTIAARVGYLIEEQGLSPEEIMAITFSRKAARELQSRVNEGVSAGTFHSIILKRCQDLELEINVLDDEESDSLYDEVAKMLGIFLNGKWLKHSRNHYKKQVKSFREGKMESPTPFVELYLSRLAISGSEDYDGILVRGISMALSGRFSNYRHVLVDESQDCEELQFEFVKALGIPTTYVGDESQCIYEFRGAKPQLLNATTDNCFSLSQTFRCPSHVVNIANKLPLETKMSTSKTDGQIIRSGKLGEVLPAILEARDPEDIAILCRYGKQVDKYSQALYDMGLQVAELQRPPRGPIWSMLKYLQCPSSETCRKGVSDKWGSISHDFKPILWASSSAPASSVHALTANYMRRFGNNPSVGDIMDAVQVPHHLLNEHKYFVQEHYDTPLSEIVSQETCAGLTEAASSGIKVMTIHASKGLEWPVVIIPELDSWPRGEPKPEDYRLFYVAVTRAEEDLVLLSETPSKFEEYYA